MSTRYGLVTAVWPYRGLPWSPRFPDAVNPMPASPISSSASNSNGSPVAPYASQAFPLSSPRPYASPPLKSHDDIGSLHDESSDEDDELQELMNKLKSSRNHTGPFISPIKPQVEGPPSPNVATGPSMTSAAVIGRMKPQSKLTGKDSYTNRTTHFLAPAN